jgi:copper(I)-binding protein
MNKPIVAALMLAGAAIPLASCGGEAEQPAEATPANTIAGIEITNARLVLPPVAGNPAAVYFDLANKGERSVTFRNATVDGAGRAEMHQSIMEGDRMVMGEAHPQTIQPGSSLEFAPGGMHVMVFDLPEDMAAGGTAEVTLVAAGGARHTFTAEIQAAGDDR